MAAQHSGWKESPACRSRSAPLRRHSLARAREQHRAPSPSTTTMETNINTAQHILQEGSYETSDSATSHAKAALSEARDAVTNGASGLASAAAQATTGLSNGSATPATTTLATTSRKAERTQVIGEDQKFSSSLSGDLSRWDMLEKGFGYDVVAVFGSQSTGKSTLLNKLFGTSFDVMDETQRRQTTKGQYDSTACRSAGVAMIS